MSLDTYTPERSKRRRPMPIINRISRLFTADLHAVLDRIEEPEDPRDDLYTHRTL